MTIIRVEQPATVIRTNGTPAVVRVENTEVRVVRSGVPGPPGEPGPRGLPGNVAGTLTWTQVTDKPALVSEAALTALRTEVLGRQNYTQAFSNSLSIVVPHGLGRYPSVTVLDTAGTEWEGAVQHDSLDQLTITHSVNFAGRVTCN